MIKALILGLLITQANLASGGIDHGNGGDIIWCSQLEPGDPTEFPGGHRKPKWVLDYLEGLDRGFQYDLGQEGWTNTPENREKIFEEFLNRVRKFSPRRATRYERWIKEFFDEAKFTSNNLVDIPDSFHLSLPPRCEIHQAIIQREPIFPEDKRYLISKQWGMNPDYPTSGRAVITAGLIIHEIILREAITLGQTNSIRTRYFHNYIASTRFHELDAAGWLKLTQNVGMPKD